MANKYSKYELKPFMNTYVDTGVKEISGILSERYDKNKAKKDLIEQSLGSMEALEGDQHLIDRVKYSVQDQLKEIARTGNWEDAGHTVDEAITQVQTDDGLLAAKKSMENRRAELEFIKQQTMEGKKVLDFGKSKASEHSSYTYNEGTSKWENNIYQADAETRLDYEDKMGKLLKTIKADASGITKGKADGIAKGLYYTYSQSDEGQQDLRRLMELEYDQSIPEKERYMMAQRDIIQRIKGFTNQYIHSTAKSPTSTGSIPLMQKYKGISVAAQEVGYTATNINTLLDSDMTTPKLLDLYTKQMKALKDKDYTRAKDLQEIHDRTIKSMVKNGKLSPEEAQIANTYEIDMWNGIDPATGNQRLGVTPDGTPGKPVGHDKAFGTYVKYLTDDRILPDFYLSKDMEWGSLAIDAGSTGVGGYTAGKGLEYVGKKVGAKVIQRAGLGLARTAWPIAAGSALGYLAYTGIKNAFFDEGNIRDVGRPESNERKKLLKTVENLSFMNKHLGTNYTEKDIPRLKLLAEQYYDYKIGQAESTNQETNGDNIGEKFNDYDGDVYEGDSYTMSFSKEGNAASTKVNNIMSHHNVTMDNFRILGAPEGSDSYDRYILDEDGKKVNGPLKFQKIIAPSIHNNTPTRMVITTPNGETAIVEAKPGNDSPLFGIMEGVVNELGLGNLTIMENVVEQLKDTPNASYSQVAQSVLNSVTKVAQLDPMDEVMQEKIFKETLMTMYGGIEKVQTIVKSKTDAFYKETGREMTHDEYQKFIDIFMFDPQNGLINNNNIYR